MANKVFISFRFSDGNAYKEKLEEEFNKLDYIINKSENENRSDMSDDTIKKYLYEKLADTSLTIVILTSEAMKYERVYGGEIDDWLYDELRYSLDDRENNRTNAVIALYTSLDLIGYKIGNDDTIHLGNWDNLVRKNICNVKDGYKMNEQPGIYNSVEDCYASLISFEEFLEEPKKYIDSALEKRDRLNQFDLTKRMD
ncbi:MAG: TIR domain-containing protein [Streptococcaceae bacterium]|nr:TIR domain-containing protein [Streptococcaceae bacterium]